MNSGADTFNTPYTRAHLVVLATIQFCQIVDVMLFVAIGPYFIGDLGLNAADIGWLASGYALAAALAGLAAAMVVDHYPRKHVLFVATLGFAIGTAACSLAGTFWALLLGRMIAGAGAGVLPGVVHAAIGEHVLESRRGAAIGVVQSAFATAAVAGLPMLLVIANLTHWRLAYALISIGAVVASLATLTLLPDPTRPPIAEGRSVGERLRLSIGSRAQWQVLLFLVITVVPSMMVVPYISIYLVGNVGLSKADLPLVYCSGGAALLMFARVIGRWSDRIGKVQVFRFFALASTLPLALVTQIGPSPLVLVLGVSILYFLLVPGRMIPAMAIVTGAAPTMARGTFLSLAGVVQQAGGAIAAMIGARLVTTASDGSIAGFSSCGYVAILASLVAAAMAGAVGADSRIPVTHPIEGTLR